MSQTIAPVLGEATVQELRESVRGEILTADDEGYAEACPRLERRTRRPSPRARRQVHRRRRRGGGDRLRPQQPPHHRRSRRRPQRRRVLDLRRRHGDRSVADEERAGRPRCSPRNGRRRRRVGGRRPRNAGVRPRNDRRSRLVHRSRRLHARRGDRVADAAVRPRMRQPRREPTSSPRTAASSMQARRRTPICCGACAEAEGTSASSHSSSSHCTRWGRWSTPARSSTQPTPTVT